MILNIACQICSRTCERNQKINCLKCGTRVHLKCANVGLNYGNHNFVCTGCHSKRRSHRETLSSHNQSDVSINSPDLLGYHSIEDLNLNLGKSQGKNLFIIHFNIVGLVLHKDDIDLLIKKMVNKPDIICITESRLKDEKIKWQSGLVPYQITNCLKTFVITPKQAPEVLRFMLTKIFRMRLL